MNLLVNLAAKISKLREIVGFFFVVSLSPHPLFPFLSRCPSICCSSKLLRVVGVVLTLEVSSIQLSSAAVGRFGPWFQNDTDFRAPDSRFLRTRYTED